MNVNFNINLTSGQKAAYDLAHKDGVKTMVLRWSRQCGKSVLAEILLIEYLCKSNSFNAYISPTFQLGRKVFKEITTLLENSGIIKKANATTLTIETVFGSTLQFFSAEAYTAIRGTTISGILIIDEAAYISDVLPNGENFWGNVVMPITKARKPLTVLISTPCGKQGFFYDFYLRALNKEEGIVELSRTIYDDDLVDEKDIEEIKKSIPEMAWRQEFLIEFLDSSLTFFQGFENCFSDYHFLEGKQWIGVDLSGNGQDETILAKVNDRNEVKIIKIEGTLDMKYQKIANEINKSNAVAIYMENNGLGAPIINEVKKQVKNSNRIYEWTTSNSSKEEIISDLAVKIANKEIFFDSKDTELFSQFATFITKITKTKKLTFAAQEGKKDDMVMAVAIALKCKKDFKTGGSPSIDFVNKIIPRII